MNIVARRAISKRKTTRKKISSQTSSFFLLRLIFPFIVILAVVSIGYSFHFLIQFWNLPIFISTPTTTTATITTPTTSTTNTTNSSMSLMSAVAVSVAVEKAIDKLTELDINFLALDFDQTILDIHTGGAWKGSLEELFPHIRPVFAQLITTALTTASINNGDGNGIEIAVVTFSFQTRFVRGVIDHIIEVGLDHDTSNKLGMIGIGGVVDTSNKIPIRGGDRSWRYSGTGSIEGKQPHMASAVEELETLRELREEEEQQQQRSAYSTTTSASGLISGSELTPSSAATTAKNANAKPPLPPITRKSTLLLDDDHRNIRHALDNGVRAIWFDPKRPNKLLPEIMKLV